MHVIPAIDLLGGRIVRLLHGDYDKVTHYDLDPLSLAKQYEKSGAKLLHIVDLDGARSGSGENTAVIETIASTTGLTVQTGGGVRTEQDLMQRLSLGVDRVVIGSLAVKSTETVKDWLMRYGSSAIVLALDVRIENGEPPMLAVHGWQEQTRVSLWDLLALYGDAVSHVLCTDISRDGAMSGPNVRLYQECVQRFPGVRFQASGGVRHKADADALAASAVDGMITGKALLEKTLLIDELTAYLSD